MPPEIYKQYLETVSALADMIRRIEAIEQTQDTERRSKLLDKRDEAHNTFDIRYSQLVTMMR